MTVLPEGLPADDFTDIAAGLPKIVKPSPKPALKPSPKAVAPVTKEPPPKAPPVKGPIGKKKKPDLEK